MLFVHFAREDTYKRRFLKVKRKSFSLKLCSLNELPLFVTGALQLNDRYIYLRLENIQLFKIDNSVPHFNHLKESKKYFFVKILKYLI